MALNAIGAAIRAARKEAGLSLSELGDELGMDKALLSRLETGVVDEIGIRKVLRVMDRLGLSMTAKKAEAGLTMEDENHGLAAEMR